MPAGKRGNVSVQEELFFSVVTARPFLKWAGGKRQLLPDIMPRIDAAPSLNGFHEPFFGGGAVFFNLAAAGRIRGLPCRLSDGNPNLIEACKALRDEPDRVIGHLREHALLHSESRYYEVRGQVPETPAARAARLIYLNKTCFNGLYRENSRGEFNVPFGKYKNPTICDEANLRACSAALAQADIEVRDFATVLDKAKPGELVYFDPPYYPLTKTASFTKYSRGDFGEADQRRLAAVAAELTRKGVHVLLSNSATELIRELYAGLAGDAYRGGAGGAGGQQPRRPAREN
jgi:DNA adenine methylase